jgi:polar amino acid transport system substrate-binding protein
MCKSWIIVLAGICLGVTFRGESVVGKELTIFASSSIPPYVIEETKKGIVADLMTQAFALQGYNLKLVVAPNRRVEEELKQHKVDGAFNAPGLPDVFYSDPIVEMQNVAVSLEQHHFNIVGIQDLRDKRVVSFQNAAKFIGAEYGEMAKNNPNYSEVNHQQSQLAMLFMGRADVIVLERRIFFYFLAKAEADDTMSKKYVIHPIFPSSPRFAAFVDARIRDIFNEGLKTLRNQGDYDKIVRSYVQEK